MRLKYPLYFRRVNGSWMGVAVDGRAKDWNCLLRINDMSYDVVKHLNTEISLDDLVARVMEEYDGSRQQVEDTVREVISRLREAEAIVE